MEEILNDKISTGINPAAELRGTVAFNPQRNCGERWLLTRGGTAGNGGWWGLWKLIEGKKFPVIHR